MTNARLTQVLVERERLLARSAQQRAALAQACAGLTGPAAVIDRAVDACRFLRAHPLGLGVLLAVVVVSRGRSVLSLALRGVSLWRLYRRLSRLLARP